jgi:hypothetical protein
VANGWPALPLSDWKETQATLHRWMQIVGKIQLARTPRVNHFWNAAFTVGPRGLRSAPMALDGGGSFTIDFDLLDHNLVVRTSRKETRALALAPRTVADFYRELTGILRSLGIEARIWDHPVELVEEAIPFHEDRRHAAYDPRAVERCFRAIERIAAVLEEFRAGFIGKASPVLFWWGSFDLSASRFSGRRAPPRPGADAITRESYSHEVSSVGWWPGDKRFPEPACFAYFAPAPAGYASAPVRPAAARWHPDLGEFLLPYAPLQRSADPRGMLLDFCESTWVAGARLGGWDRRALEAQPPPEALPAHPPP